MVNDTPQITPFPTRPTHNKLGKASSKPYKPRTSFSRCKAASRRCRVRVMLEDDAGFVAYDGFRLNEQRGADDQFALHRSRLQHLYRPLEARRSDIKARWQLRHVSFPTLFFRLCLQLGLANMLALGRQ